MTNTATNITTLDFDKISEFPNNRIHGIRISDNACYFEKEQEFARMVVAASEQEGPYLLEYCENLSDRLVRLFLVEDNVDLICEFIADELQCDRKQAHCLIELTLELIHVKVHGDFRQGHNVDLSYLISMAAATLRIRQ